MLHAMAKWLASVMLVLACSIAHAEPTPGPTTPPPPDTVATTAPVDNDFPHIYLVTMGIGSLIWERHGHIALCVEVSQGAEPDCYNYGIGDFHDPLKMVWGFFRGTHSFWAGKDTWRNMMWVYYQFDRTIWKQLLPLTAEQKQKMIVKLEHDILEENRYYAYDHFDDNCTTRIRNIIDDVTGGALSSMPNKTDGRTYRDLAREGFAGMRIPLIGTDVAMGRTTDRVPTYYQRMFLPQFLREAVQDRWGIKPIPVYVRKECVAEFRAAKQEGRAPDDSCVERGVPTVPNPPSGRVWLALILILASSPAWLTRLWGRLQRTGLAFAVIPYVLLGGIFLFLAIISPLPYVEWNETYVVWLPFDVVVLFLHGERARLYAKGRLVMMAAMVLLMIVNVLKQPLWPEMVWPLAAMLSVAFLPEKKQKAA
jgi:hypothetical protein